MKSIIFRNVLMLGVLLTALCDGSNVAAAENGGKVDQSFVTKAAQDGMAEEKLGKLASDKGQSTKIKDFGEKMQQDHAKANAKLKALATVKDISLPADISVEHSQTEKKLKALTGDEFDRAYAKEMLQAHKKAVTLFQEEATSGSDGDIKNFAKETLPTLQAHLKHAEELP